MDQDYERDLGSARISFRWNAEVFTIIYDEKEIDVLSARSILCILETNKIWSVILECP